MCGNVNAIVICFAIKNNSQPRQIWKIRQLTTQYVLINIEDLYYDCFELTNEICQ